ncbi:MAG TPA: DUF5672 family protein [Chryseolinea sp.]|nr:DUF5672 family protein [Chryseolinea sp.]
MHKMLATVVIPIHLEEPSDLEKISLQQTFKALKRYPIIFIAKKGLNTKWYQQFCIDKNFEFIVKHFKWDGFYEHGELMTNPDFYKPFLGYEYMLICHLDAFVFRDDLEQYCQSGYDFIGSHIYSPDWDDAHKGVTQLLGFTRPDYYANGGFSIRKIESFYRITSKFRMLIKLFHWIRKIQKKSFFDDIFIALYFPNLSSSFKIAPKEISQKFGAAYEKWDEKKLPFTNQNCSTLPFGVHGWIQWNPEFWKVCIRELGYKV